MNSIPQKITLFLNADDYSAFWALLSYGSKIEVTVGCSLFEVLVRQIGISENYLNEKVQTVFLNGKVVDDFFDETVKNDSVIALSAAMPGLAGAVFRKGGILSSMRSGQAVIIASAVVSKQKGEVTLKLFNMVASDLGSDFFKKGICIKGKDFIRYVHWKQSHLESICRRLEIDGRRYEIGDLLSLCRPDRDILLTIHS
jgi:hypothetical protein